MSRRIAPWSWRRAPRSRVPPERIGLNHDGTLDEIWLTGVDVHVEQMDDDHWWMAFYRAGTTDSVVLDLTSWGAIYAEWTDELGLEVQREEPLDTGTVDPRTEALVWSRIEREVGCQCRCECCEERHSRPSERLLETLGGND